jgi:predicted Zn-dependent protease
MSGTDYHITSINLIANNQIVFGCHVIKENESDAWFYNACEMTRECQSLAEAIAILRQMIEDSQNQPIVGAYLAAWMLKAGTDPAEVLPILLRAARLGPNVSAIRYTLAMVYLATARLREARREWQAVINMSEVTHESHIAAVKQMRRTNVEEADELPYEMIRENISVELVGEIFDSAPGPFNYLSDAGNISATAIDQLRTMAARSEQNHLLRYTHSSMLMAAGRRDEAAYEAESAFNLAQFSGDASALVMSADLLADIKHRVSVLN